MWYVRTAKPQSLIRAFASRWNILCEYSMNIKLLTEHHLEFLSLKMCCTGLSESHLSKYHIVVNHMSRLILFYTLWVSVSDLYPLHAG